jgi:hypothetical protein
VPVSDLEVLASEAQAGRGETRQPSEITLVRSRIFYAKPAMSAKGSVRPGFKHIRKTSNQRALDHLTLRRRSQPMFARSYVGYLFSRDEHLESHDVHVP